MFQWIIESDIARIDKALSDESDPVKQAALHQRRAGLASRLQVASMATEPSRGTSQAELVPTVRRRRGPLF